MNWTTIIHIEMLTLIVKNHTITWTYKCLLPLKWSFRSYNGFWQYRNAFDIFKWMSRSLTKIDQIQANCKVTQAPILDSNLTSLDAGNYFRKGSNAWWGFVSNFISCITWKNKSALFHSKANWNIIWSSSVYGAQEKHMLMI